MNKKGAEMTVGTIVIIVLALIVLVVLVLGFTGGWGNLWTRITSFFGGSNVDSIVQACQVACTTSSKYDYCDKNRTVKWEGPDNKIKSKGLTCKQLETDTGPKVTTLSCDIDCGIKKVKCGDLNGVWQTNSCSDPDNEKTNQVTDDSDKGDNTYCCKV